MNVIARDIGNTNITIGLFLNDREDFVRTIPGGTKGKLTNILTAAWRKIPLVKGAKVKFITLKTISYIIVIKLSRFRIKF